MSVSLEGGVEGCHFLILLWEKVLLIVCSSFPSVFLELSLLFICLSGPCLSYTIRVFSCDMWTLSYSMWNLVPWQGTELGPPVLGACSLSHWTISEVPSFMHCLVTLFDAISQVMRPRDNRGVEVPHKTGNCQARSSSLILRTTQGLYINLELVSQMLWAQEPITSSGSLRLWALICNSQSQGEGIALWLMKSHRQNHK